MWNEGSGDADGCGRGAECLARFKGDMRVGWYGEIVISVNASSVVSEPSCISA